MLEALHPPTDNLYKFSAIAGLLMIVAAVYFFYILSSRLWEKLESIQLEVVDAEGEIKLTEWKLSLLEQGQKDMPIDPQSLRQTEDDLKNLKIESILRSKFFGKMKVRQASINRHWKNFIFFSIFAFVQITFGVALAKFGFTKWYQNQIIEDKVLENSASQPPKNGSKDP